MNNVLIDIKDRFKFRKWLETNHDKENECYLVLKRGKPIEGTFSYLDAVEEALCFGWIDSTLTLINGIRMQRFSPRSKNSNWTELNKERVRRLEKLGLMTDAGRRVFPNMDFVVDSRIKELILSSGVHDEFSKMPNLYIRVRVNNLTFALKNNPKSFQKTFDLFVKKTKAGQMYGEWNDYGRLLNY